MSLRPTRFKPTKQTSPTDVIPDASTSEIEVADPPLTSSPSLSQKALAITAHLSNLLPTGTLLAFQLLTPVFTNNGACDAVTRLMTQLLLFLLAASCSLACFTDSFHSPTDARLYYGFATPRGMWLFDYYGDNNNNNPLPDLSKYRLRLVDFIHAVLSVLVFGTVALRDKNVINCFWARPEHATQEVLDAVPLAVGLVCSLFFVLFPTRRHGIGYPVTNGK